ncbi:MAG: sterol desaturase family protein [Ottowia sp.]|uniref:sterol desaturase family protein n=1 Tax=Ottowia sp. TaxID=1898956 RepID=UPI0039E3E190
MLPIILLVFVLCFVLERAWPGWPLPRIRTWPLRVLTINAAQLAVVLLAGVTWERWLSGASLLHLSAHLSPAAGGVLAYFVATFVFYWWHRVRHENDTLWRLFHQIHHSPRRLEVITSFYKHPGEMVVNAIIGSLLVYALLGLSPRAGAVYTLCTALGEFFYHTNMRTPHWVGWFFQRPEMHRIHHQHGRHRNNYGDITWWDMLFGTYENPRQWHGRCGFDADKEERLIDMLLYRDVHRDVPQPSQCAGNTEATHPQRNFRS